MDIKKLLIGGIIAGVLFFLLGWLAYGKVFQAFFASHPGAAGPIGRPNNEMLLVYIFAGNLLHGFVLSFVFVKARIGSLVSGAVTGGVIGFLIAGGVDSLMYGTSTIISKTAAAADVAIVTALWVITGAILGVLNGMNKKEV